MEIDKLLMCEKDAKSPKNMGISPQKSIKGEKLVDKLQVIKKVWKISPHIAKNHGM